MERTYIVSKEVKEWVLTVGRIPLLMLFSFDATAQQEEFYRF